MIMKIQKKHNILISGQGILHSDTDHKILRCFLNVIYVLYSCLLMLQVVHLDMNLQITEIVTY